MKSQNGGSPAKAKEPAHATTEITTMDPIAALESRRIPCFITRRPFTSDAPPMASASTPNQSGKSVPVPYASWKICCAELR